MIASFKLIFIKNLDLKDAINFSDIQK